MTKFVKNYEDRLKRWLAFFKKGYDNYKGVELTDKECEEVYFLLLSHLEDNR